MTTTEPTTGPRLLTHNQREDFKHATAYGMDPDWACLHSRCTLSDVELNCAQDPDFALEVGHESIQMVYEASRCIRHAVNDGNWRAADAYLRHKHPDKYGTTRHRNSAGSNDSQPKQTRHERARAKWQAWSARMTPEDGADFRGQAPSAGWSAEQMDDRQMEPSPYAVPLDTECRTGFTPEPEPVSDSQPAPVFHMDLPPELKRPFGICTIIH